MRTLDLDQHGPIISCPDGYFRTVPSDTAVELQSSGIPWTRRVYNGDGSIMGTAEQLSDVGVLTVRLEQGADRVTEGMTHMYGSFSFKPFVPSADD
jgi:hypothetical protein